MIRVLIIGRTASSWAEELGRVAGAAVELDVARLPSAGIRQLEEMPPDLVIIVDEVGGQRVETLVAAIRNRPIGQLLAILLLCPQPSGAEVLEKIGALELAGWLPVDASVREVIREIEQTLDVVLADPGAVGAGVASVQKPEPSAMPPGMEQKAAGVPGPVVTRDYLLEPLGFEPPGYEPPGYEPPGYGAPGQDFYGSPEPEPFAERRSMFPTRASTGFDGGLDAESVLRKLKEVRHEDYYAVLEIRRGAESQTVREAFYRLYAKFDPQKVDFELSHRYHAEFSEIRDALEDAWAVLGDPDLREPYLAHTVRK